MNRLLLILLLAVCYGAYGKPQTETEKTRTVEEKCVQIQNRQAQMDRTLQGVSAKLKSIERNQQTSSVDIARLRSSMDSLQNVCRQLETTQSADRRNITGKIGETDNSVREGQTMLQNRTIYGVLIVLVMLIIIIGIAYKLSRRIKSGRSTIDDVRKAQDALQAAQTKMQEESVKLDDKLLELLNRQIEAAPQTSDDNAPDHSLALKVADEVARIEVNMSRMDPSVRGYKQLSKAVKRIKDNFVANDYEIVDMLGKPYDFGMKVTADFVFDESLEEGKRIITNITKPQVNYKGKMIQAAQIKVSQNI